MKQTLEDIAWGIAIFLVFATLLWAILEIPAGAQTIRVIRHIFLSENISPVDSILVIQQKPDNPKYGWITDSITWVKIDTTFAGGQHCQHDWVYGEPEISGNRFGDYDFDKYTINIVCARGAHYANGKWDESPWHSLNEHCPYEEKVREKICRYCARGVVEREKWFQHFVAPPKTEFEILKERQRNKQ